MQNRNIPVYIINLTHSIERRYHMQELCEKYNLKYEFINAVYGKTLSEQEIDKLYEKDEIRREDFRKFLQSSQDVANLIEKNLERTASLVQSFKQVSTDQVTEQQRVFAFKEYLEDLLISLRPKFSNKNIDFKIECDEKLKLNSYPGVYARYLQTC